MSENIDAQTIQQTGVIISLSREIESVMTELGAEAAGLHDKTDFLRPRLSEECVKVLHYIASVRNSNAHENVTMTKEDMELFVKSCETVLQELKELLPEKSEKKDIPPTEEVMQKSDQKDYDRDFLMQVNQIWRMLAWIPFVHCLYFAGGILRELKKSAMYILLFLFYFSGIILIGTGISDKNTFFWGSGLFIFVMVWLYTLLVRLFNKEIKLHLYFCLIPFLNIIFIVYMLKCKTPIIRLGLYVALLILYASGIYLLFNGKIIFGSVLLGISYVGGMVDSLFSKIKREQNVKADPKKKDKSATK